MIGPAIGERLSILTPDKFIQQYAEIQTIW